ncbi:MAG: aminotransferase class IV [Bacteroidota bacterium]|jgi:aminodeoxychorismate lyase
MSATDFLFLDGHLMRQDKANLSVNNRSFRYGDGCFETIRVVNRQIKLASLHFERLFTSIDALKFNKPSYMNAEWLQKNILEVVDKNGHQKLARVRVMIYRGDGGLYDPENHFPHHLIQSFNLSEATQELNQNGLTLGIYKEAKKSSDFFSMIKSNSYLPYVMAALWAKENNLNDAILLNHAGGIADTTIANLFIIKDGTIKTPAITEGPVAGVMRRHLIKTLRANDYEVEETTVSVADVLEASEVFLTSAIHGIKWVKQIDNSQYNNSLTTVLYKDFIQTL